ncbi:hypothetical protein ACLESO_18795 [Pyxidicoccus sp. 3LG]
MKKQLPPGLATSLTTSEQSWIANDVEDWSVVEGPLTTLPTLREGDALIINGDVALERELEVAASVLVILGDVRARSVIVSNGAILSIRGRLVADTAVAALESTLQVGVFAGAVAITLVQSTIRFDATPDTGAKLIRDTTAQFVVPPHTLLEASPCEDALTGDLLEDPYVLIDAVRAGSPVLRLPT